MYYKAPLFFFLFICGLTVYSQTDSRINTIENQLELLKVDYPAFEEKVNVNITNTSLSNFLLAVSKVHGININVSPELETITIINNFSEVSIEDLLIFLAKEYDLDIRFTGNIISVSRYEAPVQEPVETEIKASYDPLGELLSLDLQQEPLEKVFRKLTDVSGKNMVFAPGMENLRLSIYISDVPFDAAMEKLALTNGMEVILSRDGFYIFNRDSSSENANGVNRAISAADNFFYRILDAENRTLEVEFNNVPAADIIHSIGADLDLDIFTANSLQELGQVSIKAQDIQFDRLLDIIFESVNINNIQQEPSTNLGRQGGSMTRPPSNPALYTYKKEDGLYFFGTEDQLALKQVEVVQMMHRSIEMLSNPSGNTGGRRPGNSNFETGNTNFYNGNNAQGYNQNGQYNQNNTQMQRAGTAETTAEAIQKIIPDDLQEGIHIKVDSELNSFIVSGPATRIERFKNFIKYIDKPVPVILIEVMILEVNRTAVVETGVSFGLGEEAVETQGQAFPSADMRLGAQTANRIIGGFDGFGSLNIGKVLPNFYADIKAMEANGNIKILSTPKLSTLNGHKAHLSSGETTYYAVTNQNFFGSQIPQTSEITNYYPIDAELALNIMPFVSGDGEITLDINVVQSSFNGERIAENAPPGMNSREFSSIIRMRDQDIAILGGIEERTKDDSGSGVPLLARIPVIKWFFSERRREDSRKKLNILIKPTVIY